MKKSILFGLCVLIGTGQHVLAQNMPEKIILIPTAGNTWLSGDNAERSRDGEIRRWQSAGTKFTTYFRTAKTGFLNLYIHAKVPSGTSSIQITVNKEAFPLQLRNTDWQRIPVGKFHIKDTGYQSVVFAGISKTGEVFADIDSVEISGAATEGELSFTPNNEGGFYHWGRRGPSVHLVYQMPSRDDVEWFYNEVTIPVGKDPIGSYFMADGFSVGYFGFQVNSTDTRHVLFSVWSPFSTDHPEEIPDADKIHLLKKGAAVHAGNFGGEGSGGQSYLDYPWVSGQTYKFLLHAHPNADSTTDFTAYFQDPAKGKWMLVAGFRRPRTNTWLKGLHSFTENFSPEQGNVDRIATYNNQWVRTADGKWLEVRKAKLTGDNTARKNYRKDYAGGLEGNSFYLRNGGFFNGYVPLDQIFERADAHNEAPEIDLSQLP